MSKLNISKLTNENEDGAPKITGISTFSSTAFLEVPKGTTAQRSEYVQPGMIRFNTDGAHLEYYNGVEWTEVLVANNTLDGGNRGLSVGGGIAPTFNENIIDYITISTLGNAIDFGDTSALGSGYRCTALGNSTRAVYGGAYGNTIEYVTFSSTGNGTDFGDLIYSRINLSSLANSTRGIFTGGNSYAPTYVNNNVIEYITISSTGNAVQFGNLTTSGARAFIAAAASSVRGIFAGGYTAPSFTNTIDYITISTTGSAIDFGDLTKGTTGFTGGGGSNSTRMLIAGGYRSGPATDDFTQFITISTLGDAQDFGDIGSTSNSRPFGSACSSTRAVFGGGYGARTPGNLDQNAMAYYTIATTGNAIDFGDTTTTRLNHFMCSNGHGGL